MLGLSGWVGEPGGGTLGLVFGVFGLEDGGGISGALGGTEGEVGGGVCCVQPAVVAAKITAASVNFNAFISALLLNVRLSDRTADYSPSALTPASAAID